MPYYKVTDIENGSLSLSDLNKYRTIYKENKWIKAPIGGFFIFDDKQKALEFAAGFTYWGTKIWEIAAREFIDLSGRSMWGTLQSNIEKFWGDHKNDGYVLFPEGTLCAKEVKLMKLIEQLDN